MHKFGPNVHSAAAVMMQTGNDRRASSAPAGGNQSSRTLLCLPAPATAAPVCEPD